MYSIYPIDRGSEYYLERINSLCFPTLRALKNIRRKREKDASGLYHRSLICTRIWKSIMIEYLVLPECWFLCYSQNTYYLHKQYSYQKKNPSLLPEKCKRMHG